MTKSTLPTAVGIHIFAGLFTQGVRQAGFDVLATLEDGPFGVATHRRNFPDTRIYDRAAGWPVEELRERGVDLVYSNSPCYVAGTKVMTEAGEVPIEAIQVGQHVLTHLGRWRKVTKVYRRTSTGNTVTVVPKLGRDVFELTPNHPILSRKDLAKEGWLAAADLRPGDHLLSPRALEKPSHPAKTSGVRSRGRGSWIEVDRVIVNPIRTCEVFNLEVDEDQSYVAAGFATHNCAGLSLANANRGPDNDTNQGLELSAATALEIRPRAYVVESVGNLFKEGDQMVARWEAAWRQAGYNTYRVIEDALDLGVAQRRRRALFVAIQGDLALVEPAKGLAWTVGDAIRGLEAATCGLPDKPLSGQAQAYPGEPDGPYERWLRRGSSSLTWHVAPKVSVSLGALLPCTPPDTRLHELPDDVMRLYWAAKKPGTKPNARPGLLNRRLGYDRPSVVLTGGCNWFHPTQDRYISLREKARLMGVPDRFDFVATNLADAYAQCGKAVSPVVGTWIGRQVLAALNASGATDHAQLIA